MTHFYRVSSFKTLAPSTGQSRVICSAQPGAAVRRIGTRHYPEDSAALLRRLHRDQRLANCLPIGLSQSEKTRKQYGGTLFSAPDYAEWPNHEELVFIGSEVLAPVRECTSMAGSAGHHQVRGAGPEHRAILRAVHRSVRRCERIGRTPRKAGNTACPTWQPNHLAVGGAGGIACQPIHSHLLSSG